MRIAASAATRPRSRSGRPARLGSARQPAQKSRATVSSLIEHARSLRRALKVAGNPVHEWHVEAMEGHGFGDAENPRLLHAKRSGLIEAM